MSELDESEPGRDVDKDLGDEIMNLLQTEVLLIWILGGLDDRVEYGVALQRDVAVRQCVQLGHLFLEPLKGLHGELLLARLEGQEGQSLQVGVGVEISHASANRLGGDDIVDSFLPFVVGYEAVATHKEQRHCHVVVCFIEHHTQLVPELHPILQPYLFLPFRVCTFVQSRLIMSITDGQSDFNIYT